MSQPIIFVNVDGVLTDLETAWLARCNRDRAEDYFQALEIINRCRTITLAT